ncbi:MAG: restriction endonuclease [Anaerolineae bacterium]|nr:restriction endonuclease [Anaerolineae bacterium]
MVNVWCVRAESGAYTQKFIEGSYIAVGGIPGVDLSKITTKDELVPLYRKAHPGDSSPIIVGREVSQLARFLLDMKPGDYVITPAADAEWLHYGTLSAKPAYLYVTSDAGCPYRHRRRVSWAKNRLLRADLSVPFQNTLRSSLTVFAISQRDEFFARIGQEKLVSAPQTVYDAQQVVLDQVLQLDDREFEVLITHLLTAMGFEGCEHTGKTGDGGVDVIGELNVANLVRVKVYVQAKRYKTGTRVSATTVKQLRAAIPVGGQGALITTSDFQKQAHDVATESGFPRIGLINGWQLVDLLIEHWDDIPEFHERLGLRPGLVRG